MFTPGGVIAAGQKLMDIVPTGRRWWYRRGSRRTTPMIYASARPTLVRFPSLHDRTLADLNGRLTQLSADSFVDERTGEAFYTDEVTVSPEELAAALRRHGGRLALRSGMPAEVLVPPQARTVLDYTFEPLLGSFWSAFREH